MMIEDDGWMTIYATGGFRPGPFTVRDIRAAVETLRKNALPTTDGRYFFDGARGFVEPPPCQEIGCRILVPHDHAFR